MASHSDCVDESAQIGLSATEKASASRALAKLVALAAGDASFSRPAPLQ